MPDLLATLDAFLQEHRRCGELDGGVDGQWVWISCDCLPGGWKLEFQAVKTEQQRQAQEIDALKFLVANFLTEPECKHLEGLASDKPYWARRDATTAYFEMEIRRLRALGFIQGFPDHGVHSLLRAMAGVGGKEINVKEHFEITARGRDYLRLRTEMLAAMPGPAEN
jgi:hypothetical protein